MEQKTLSCQLCGLLSPDLRSYISHVRQVHTKDPNFSLTCEIRECSQQFSTFGAFNSHVYRAHRDSLGLGMTSANDDAADQYSIEEPTSSTLSATQSSFPVLHCFGNHELPEDLQYDIWHLLGVDQQQEQREAAKFLLKLKEICRVSEHTVNEVVTGYRRLFAHSLRIVKASVKDSLGNAGVNMSDINGLEEAFADVPDVFKGLHTSYLQEKYFRDHFNLHVSIIREREYSIEEPFLLRLRSQAYKN